MEAKKSHKMWSASWRPKKASGVVLVQVQSPENQENQWCKSQSNGKDQRSSPVLEVRSLVSSASSSGPGFTGWYQVLGSWTLIWRLWGRVSFQTHSVCWQNSVIWAAGVRLLFCWWLSARSLYQLLQATWTPHHVALSIFKLATSPWVLLVLWIHLLLSQLSFL